MTSPRRLAALVALIAVLAVSLTLGRDGTALAPPVDDDPYMPPVGTCANELDLTATPEAQREAMRCLVEHVRRNAGLPPLAVDLRLWASAHDKALDIVACGEFSHEACGRATSHWAREKGYGRDVGENISLGPVEWGTARTTINRWLRSPGHRANILDPGYRDLGVGLAQTATFRGWERWQTQVWVQQFGSGS